MFITWCSSTNPERRLAYIKGRRKRPTEKNGGFPEADCVDLSNNPTKLFRRRGGHVPDEQGVGRLSKVIIDLVQGIELPPKINLRGIRCNRSYRPVNTLQAGRKKKKKKEKEEPFKITKTAKKTAEMYPNTKPARGHGVTGDVLKSIGVVRSVQEVTSSKDS